LLGHEIVICKIDSINQNARPISRCRTCPPQEPARAKPKRTVRDVLISNRTAQIIASQTDSLKPQTVSWPNKYCVDHLRPIRAASGLIFPSLYWQSGFVNVILHGMADWKPNCEKPQTPLGRFIPNPKLKFMEQCR
jgi:hypothetical protein